MKNEAMKYEAMSDIPTPEERAENHRQVMKMSKKERFETLLGCPTTAMSDTPETDASIIHALDNKWTVQKAVPVEIARQIERKLNAALAERDDIYKDGGTCGIEGYCEDCHHATPCAGKPMSQCCDAIMVNGWCVCCDRPSRPKQPAQVVPPEGSESTSCSPSSELPTHHDTTI